MKVKKLQWLCIVTNMKLLDWMHWCIIIHWRIKEGVFLLVSAGHSLLWPCRYLHPCDCISISVSFLFLLAPSPLLFLSLIIIFCLFFTIILWFQCNSIWHFGGKFKYGKRYIKDNLIKSLGWLGREIDMLVTKEQYLSIKKVNSWVLTWNVPNRNKADIECAVTGASRWDSQHTLAGQVRGWWKEHNVW